MPAATSLDKSLTQRSASTINRNNESAGEASSREMARTAVDIGSLSATPEANRFLPSPEKGRDFLVHRGEKHPGPVGLRPAPGRLRLCRIFKSRRQRAPPLTVSALQS